MLVPFLLAFCACLVGLILVLFLCIWVALYRAPNITRKSSLGRSAAVVVLGDVGRSPRMCYHVESLANEGWRVAVVGYKGTVPPPALRRASIKHHHLRTPPKFIASLPRAAFAIVAPFKVLLQSTALFWELAVVVQPPPEVILVQTPPALPTLMVVRTVSLLLGSRVIIDWHNLGYTILALRMGQRSPMVQFAEWLEKVTGRVAFAHLFVTHAMMTHLSRKWGLVGRKVVLHDRPPEHFRPSTVAERHNLMSTLAPKLNPSCDAWFPTYHSPDSTPFTERVSERMLSVESPQELRPDSPSSYASSKGPAGGIVEQLRDDRPALVVSSTSWTADEDFGVLLRAAAIYEQRARELAKASKAPSGSHAHTASLPNRATSSTPLQSSSHTPNGSSMSRTFTNETPMIHSPSSSGSFTPSGLGSIRHRESFSSTSSAGGPPTSSSTGVGRSRDRRASFEERRNNEDALPNEPATALPKMLIIVTGKGELRQGYEREIARLERDEKWEYVRIRTVWLEVEDYPVLLGSADVGVSLHRSSSGLDLPMKVVDMYGCGLPVCAFDFDCLPELVRHRENGLVFSDAETLARQLESLLATHPGPSWLRTSMGDQSPFEAGPSQEQGGEAGSYSSSPRTSTTHLPPIYTTALPSRPASPADARFSLLASPIMSATRIGGSSGASLSPATAKTSTATWSRNWKHVVRPLLVAAEAEDDDERLRILAGHGRGGAKRRPQGGKGAGGPRREQHTPLLSLSFGGGGGGGHTGHAGAWEGESETTPGEEEQEPVGDETYEATAVLSDGARRRLRQRSVAHFAGARVPKRHGTGGSWNSEGTEGIPDIHISAPGGS